MISKFMNARSKKPIDVDIKTILKEIRDGQYKDQIETLRKIDRENDEQAYSDAKIELPAVTFSGQFSSRADAALIKHSGVMCLDWDHLEEDALDHKKMKCEQDRYIIAYFDSPGGEGLKALIKTPVLESKEEHDKYYAELLRMYPDADPKNANLSRLCFVSYDPDLYYQPDKHTFTLESNPAMASMPKIPEMGASNQTRTEVDVFAPVDKDRNTTLTAAAGIHFKNGMSANDVLTHISNQNNASNNPLKQSEVDTIVNSVSRYHSEGTLPKSEEEVQDLDVILKKSMINANTKVEPPVAIVQYVQKGGMSFEKYNLLTLGNFSLIKGWKGAKKTALTSALISIAMGDDSRGFLVGSLPEDKKHVVYIDTEQFESETKIVFDRIDKDIPDSEHFMSFNFREQDYKMRCDLIDRIFERANGQIGMMIIDGISDLAKADNDEDDATRVAQLLMTWTAKYKCHIVAVIHTNKGREDATGWLGSKVEKKASAVVMVEKDKETKQSVVKNDKNRHAMEFMDFLIKIENNRVVFEEKEEFSGA